MLWTLLADANGRDLAITLCHLTSLLHVVAHLSLIQSKATAWTVSEIVALEGLNCRGLKKTCRYRAPIWKISRLSKREADTIASSELHLK